MLDQIFFLKFYSQPRIAIMITIIVLFSISLHEYFHAQVALWMGDSTAAEKGHLTLNPLRQMGPTSLAMFALVGIAWGAVPYNINRFRTKWGHLLMSLAGPAANLLLIAIAWITMALLTYFNVFDFAVHKSGTFVPNPLTNSLMMKNLYFFIYFLGIFNTALFLLNMLPIPGLDGWHVFAYFFPKIKSVQSETLKGTMLFMIIVVLISVRYFFIAGEFLMHRAVIFSTVLERMFPQLPPG